MNCGKTVTKIAPAFRFNRLLRKPCRKATRPVSRCAGKTGFASEAGLFFRKLEIRLRRPRYTRYAAPINLNMVKATTDASRRAATPSTDASAQKTLPAPTPKAVKEAARLPARSAFRV